jgi:hypothetical protein
MDAIAIGNNEILYSHFRKYCLATNSSLINTIDKINLCSKFDKKLSSEQLSTFFYRTFSNCKQDINLSLGQLSSKEEAAGKLRIFAIVDG